MGLDGKFCQSAIYFCIFVDINRDWHHLLVASKAEFLILLKNNHFVNQFSENEKELVFLQRK